MQLMAQIDNKWPALPDFLLNYWWKLLFAVNNPAAASSANPHLLGCHHYSISLTTLYIRICCNLDQPYLFQNNEGYDVLNSQTNVTAIIGKGLAAPRPQTVQNSRVCAEEESRGESACPHYWRLLREIWLKQKICWEGAGPNREMP